MATPLPALPRPSFLWLPRVSLARRDVVRTLVRRVTGVRGQEGIALEHAFAFKSDELAFARALLASQSRLWLYRTNQRAFAGDFVVVDVSSPVVARRPAYAVELKRGAAAKMRDEPSVQLRNADRVVREIAALGVVDSACRPAMLTGDAREVIAVLSR